MKSLPKYNHKHQLTLIILIPLIKIVLIFKIAIAQLFFILKQKILIIFYASRLQKIRARINSNCSSINHYNSHNRNSNSSNSSRRCSHSAVKACYIKKMYQQKAQKIPLRKLPRLLILNQILPVNCKQKNNNEKQNNKKNKNFGYIKTRQLIKYKQQQQKKEKNPDPVTVNPVNSSAHTPHLQVVPTFKNLSLQNLITRSRIISSNEKNKDNENNSYVLNNEFYPKLKKIRSEKEYIQMNLPQIKNFFYNYNQSQSPSQNQQQKSQQQQQQTQQQPETVKDQCGTTKKLTTFINFNYQLGQKRSSTASKINGSQMKYINSNLQSQNMEKSAFNKFGHEQQQPNSIIQQLQKEDTKDGVTTTIFNGTNISNSNNMNNDNNNDNNSNANQVTQQQDSLPDKATQTNVWFTQKTSQPSQNTYIYDISNNNIPCTLQMAPQYSQQIQSSAFPSKTQMHSKKRRSQSSVLATKTLSSMDILSKINEQLSGHNNPGQVGGQNQKYQQIKQSLLNKQFKQQLHQFYYKQNQQISQQQTQLQVQSLKFNSHISNIQNFASIK
eukprot:TRINITY_DN7183_c0_g1_i5.p1 TRINITY_DN7183_c0_g1~~TRINITY_DN7183_c0_g1_i5.p1  ORF type:complete len:554 (-),score=80.07 TRINITY_DN7183_c0_g1_i5:167-1828(-)